MLDRGQTTGWRGTVQRKIQGKACEERNREQFRVYSAPWFIDPATEQYIYRVKLPETGGHCDKKVGPKWLDQHEARVTWASKMRQLQNATE